MRKNLSFIKTLLILFILFTSCKSNSSKTKNQFNGIKITPFNEITLYDSFKNYNILTTLSEDDELLITEISIDGIKVKVNKDSKNYSGWIEFSNLIFPPEFVEIFVPLALDEDPFADYLLRFKNFFAIDIEQINKAFDKIMELPTEKLRKINPKEKINIYYRLIDRLLNPRYRYLPSNNYTNPFHYISEFANYDFLTEYYDSHSTELITHKDEEGLTCLMHAIKAENYDAVKFLYEHNADIYHTDNAGNNVEYYVSNCKNKDIKELLSIASLNITETEAECIEFLKEHQSEQNFKTLHFSHYEVPYTIWHRAKKINANIKASCLENFMEELAIAENIYYSDDSQNETFAEDDNFNDYAFIFIHDKSNYIEYDSNVNIRKTPDLNGKIITKLPYGTKVKILEASENSDTIEDVTDYWYKISADNTEGWCFGNYLVYPVKGNLFNPPLHDHSHDTWYTQLPFLENDFATVIKEAEIISPEGTKHSVKPLEKVQIILTFNKKDTPESDKFYEYTKLDEKYAHNILIRYPYYYIRNSKNEYGIISGSALIHDKIKYNPPSCLERKDCNKIWYASYMAEEEDFISYVNADIYEEDTTTHEIRKYLLGEVSGIEFIERPLRVGRKDTDAYNRFKNYLEVYNFQNYTIDDYSPQDDTTYKNDITIIEFVSLENSLEKGTSKVYNLYTVKQNGMAVESLYEEFSEKTETDCFLSSEAFLGHADNDVNIPNLYIDYYGRYIDDPWSEQTEYSVNINYSYDNSEYKFIEVSRDEYDYLPEF